MKKRSGHVTIALICEAIRACGGEATLADIAAQLGSPEARVSGRMRQAMAGRYVVPFGAFYRVA